jgi:hypothetical protein
MGMLTRMQLEITVSAQIVVLGFIWHGMTSLGNKSRA